MGNSEQLLEIRGLGKRYASRSKQEEEHKALSDIDFEAHPGELISVIGPSGAGKSTFLRCVNRLIEPTDGQILFEGQDITHLKRGQLRSVHRQIAMIFQNYNLVYRLTAVQNVLHGRLGYKNPVAGSLGLYTEEEKMHAFELLDEVGLGEFAYRRADQLSGGQMQRVGIARALNQDPKIILADEPIASLDPKSSKMVMDHLLRVARERGICCIVNLHQVDFAREYSDRIVALRFGEKVFEGTSDELTASAVRHIYEGAGDDDALVEVEVPDTAAQRVAGAAANLADAATATAATAAAAASSATPTTPGSAQ